VPTRWAGGNVRARGRETLPIFLSDVKARHDRMVELVERGDGYRPTANGSRLSAFAHETSRLGEFVHRHVGGFVHRAPLIRLTVDSPKRHAACGLRVTGSSTMLYAWMQTVMSDVAEMERAGFRANRHGAAFKPEGS